MANPRSRPPPALRGRWLFFARTAWVALAALTMGLFVASVPVAYKRLRNTCEGDGCGFWQLSLEDASVLKGWGLSMDFYAAYNVALAIVFALGFSAIGWILFQKGSENLLVLCASMALVAFGATQPDTLGALMEAYPRWDLPVAYAYFVGNVSFFVLFCVFPDGRFVPRWTRWAAAVWVVYQLLYSFFPASLVSPRRWPLLIDVSLFVGLILSLVVAQAYRYRRAPTQEQRQQTKWVVFGFAIVIVVLIGTSLMGWIFALTHPGIPQVLYWLVGDALISLSALLIPLSIGVAILRYRLWDIDLIIRRSLVIGPLATTLTVVFELANQLLLPFLFRFIPSLDHSSSIKTIVSVLIVVVLFKPLQARIELGVTKLADRLAGGEKASNSPQRA